jgi:hypothetical protein
MLWMRFDDAAACSAVSIASSYSWLNCARAFRSCLQKFES